MKGNMYYLIQDAFHKIKVSLQSSFFIIYVLVDAFVVHLRSHYHAAPFFRGLIASCSRTERNKNTISILNFARSSCSFDVQILNYLHRNLSDDGFGLK